MLGNDCQFSVSTVNYLGIDLDHKALTLILNIMIKFKFHIIEPYIMLWVLIDFSFTVRAATLIFISKRGSAISSAKQGKSGSIYNMVKN